jgi:hypothetical protein
MNLEIIDQPLAAILTITFSAGITVNNDRADTKLLMDRMLKFTLKSRSSVKIMTLSFVVLFISASIFSNQLSLGELSRKRGSGLTTARCANKLQSV